MAQSPALSIAKFERHVTETNQLDRADRKTSVLGLVGEIGSLVSVLKKKRREAGAFFGYRQAVNEELGDVLWYMSAVAQTGGTSLLETIAMTTSRRPDAPLTFAKLDESRERHGPRALEQSLLSLAGEAGHLAKRFAEGAYDGNVDALRGDLSKLVRPLCIASSAARVQISEAAAGNILKTEGRWPTKRIYPRPADAGLHVDEQLPRKIRVLIYERHVNGTKFVFQKMGGVLLGDRLTDNHFPPDDYRFHDVFHLAHAMVLGWSPTTRALLKIKRKSQKHLDENEDGARANLIEEGLTTWIFEVARHHSFFANTSRLGFDILKGVKQFVHGYEAEKMPMWLWEEAILQGYAAFRTLRRLRHGVVVGNMKQRKLWVEEMTEKELRICGLR
jgi:NTP pyrophosphatase (non-canonical NTP hydrolase)